MRFPIAILLLSPFFALTQDTSLHMAVVEGNRDSVQLMLSNGADINATMPGGYSPLMLSIKYGQIDIMKDLLGANAGVDMKDNKGNTALILAVTARNIEAVRLLLANRADVNIRNNEGMTALDVASLLDMTEIATLINDYLAQKG